MNNHKAGKIVSLFLEVKELDRDDLHCQPGDMFFAKHPLAASAECVAEVRVNKKVLGFGKMKRDDILLIEVFNKRYRVLISRARYGDISNFWGSIIGTETGVMVLSASGYKVTATLEIAENNIIYFLGFNQAVNAHYLFETQIDKVKRLKDGPILYPPGN